MGRGTRQNPTASGPSQVELHSSKRQTPATTCNAAPRIRSTSHSQQIQQPETDGKLGKGKATREDAAETSAEPSPPPGPGKQRQG
ncbi:hypothetical protein M0R45_026663 [Rubus argutus]|uniref:Uncharacterized protein n=1 Tax=Rubus argutus TaxID=59490 RepID=A0AAW1WZI4_RUBAR